MVGLVQQARVRLPLPASWRCLVATTMAQLACWVSMTMPGTAMLATELLAAGHVGRPRPHGRWPVVVRWLSSCRPSPLAWDRHADLSHSLMRSNAGQCCPGLLDLTRQRAPFRLQNYRVSTANVLASAMQL
mmetsp:Transcript_17331/g.52137  ORF Transcript_17331/g.52137 Transcript_17331/m.52137 type:complete len:131 (-) Transcript_17331:166-558(-)